MTKLTRICIIEDNPAHAEIILRSLEYTGEDYQISVYETLGDFRNATKDQLPDLILADLNLPDGTALEILQQWKTKPEYPVIVMTSQGDEASAVQAMKFGALDYITKSQGFFQDIPRTIIRVWREWRLMQKNAQAEALLRESEKKFRSIFEGSPDAFSLTRVSDWVVTDVNEGFCKLAGLSASEIIGKASEELDFWHEPIEKNELMNGLANEKVIQNIEMKFKQKSGKIFTCLVSAIRIVIDAEEYVMGIIRDIEELKQAELKLASSQQQYKYLFDNNPQPMWVFDLETWDFLEVNLAAIKHYGYSHEEFLQLKISDIRPKEDIPALEKSLNEADEEYEQSKAWRHLKKNGDIIYVDVVSHQIEFAGHKARLVLANDVTTRMEAEKALLESEEKFRQIAENVSETFWISERGKKIYINKNYERIFGLNTENILADPDDFYKVVHPDDHERVFKSDRNFDETGTFNEQFRVIKKDGSIHWIWAKVRPIYNENGELYRSVGIAQDITEIKEAQERLQKLSMAVEQSANTVIVTDTHGNIEYVNKKFEEVTGYSFAEVEGKSPSIMKSGNLPKEVYNNLWTTITQGKEWKGEFCNRTKSGNLFWESATIAPIKNDDGEIINFLAIKEDITMRKHMENELKTSQDHLDRAQKVARIGSWYIDVESLKLDCSQITAEIFGLQKAEELTFDTFLNKIHPEDVALVKSSLTEAMKGATYDIEHRITVDGQIRWVREVGDFQINRQGKAIFGVGLTYDITSRREIEELIRYNERFLNSILDQLPQVLQVFDGEGRLIRNNRASEAVFTNFQKDNKKIFNGLTDTFYTKIGLAELLSQAYKGSTTNGIELLIDFKRQGRSHSKIREKRWFSVNVFSIKNKTEKIDAVVLIMDDITKRKLGEEMLIKSEEKFSRTFNLSPDVIALIDEESGTIEEINDQGLEKFSSNGMMVNLKIQEINILTEENDWSELMKKYHQQKGQLFTELFLRKKNGERIYCDLSARRIRFGGRYHMILVIRDINDRKLAEIQLQNKNEEMIDINKRLAEYRLMALRSVMNPHFIFNCLNSIQYYISNNERRLAIDYMSLFSKLIRSVLNSSVDMYISLSQEIEILKYYIELELMRFDEKFEYEIKVKKGIDLDFTEVPSMLLQPYVENAIVHGLLNKKGKGRLQISIAEIEGELLCTIEDNGVGRKYVNEHANSKSKHKSLGMTVTEERLEIINRNDSVSVKIDDLYTQDGSAAGTKVLLKLSLAGE
ncbi:MAG: PAS domain S-box protein [Cyclobacteriaceae bacterium]